ncbi:NADPH-dependent FMN reductase [Brevibacterium casei]|uniref:NADPH-dependent FMN reductase n=1 Tax=Brevibacterium casei TaxID=33889 RepID=UPI0029529423|nr:NAD(P)H-dependent oxidoreductase [Brevibacterium casei]
MAEIVSEADGIVFVTPQYNGGYPASLKNAIDYLFAEWRDKPALIVSYGGHGGGMSGAQLRSVLEFIGVDLRRRQRRDHPSPRVVRRRRSPRRCPGDRPGLR